MSIPQNTTSQLTFTVSIYDDSIVEGTENFTLQLNPAGNITIANNSQILFIIADDDSLCDSSPCHQAAICLSIGTIVSCTCLQPFVGDGFSCQIPDPCSQNLCHANATCIAVSISMSGDSSGSGSGMENGIETGEVAQCICVPPYVGNGTSCDLPDPCADAPCGENAVCERVVTGDAVNYSCACMSMFVRDEMTMSCVMRK